MDHRVGFASRWFEAVSKLSGCAAERRRALPSALLLFLIYEAEAGRLGARETKKAHSAKVLRPKITCGRTGRRQEA